jgi:serine/threonine protein kinase
MSRTVVNVDEAQPKLLLEQEMTRLITADEYSIFRDQIIAEAEWSAIYVGELTPNHRQPMTRTPFLLAIKMPKSKQSAQVLVEEARVLSHLWVLQGYERFVVNFLGLDPSNGAVVLEKMDISLHQYIRTGLEHVEQRPAVLEAVFPSIALQLVHSLEWLHDVGQVVHGDIKPSNILLHKAFILSNGEPEFRAAFPYKAVLADFGSSRFLADETKSKCGNTREYMAPENMSSAASETPPTVEADVWAMGITLLAIITGRAPYYRLSWPMMFPILREGDPVMHERNASSIVRERLDAAEQFTNIIHPALQRSPTKRIKPGPWLDMLHENNTDESILRLMEHD